MSDEILSQSSGADLRGANLTNAVIDRVDFSGADLTGATLRNAVLTGLTWTGAILTDVDFEDALIGSQDAAALCANPSLVGASRAGVGCRSGK